MSRLETLATAELKRLTTKIGTLWVELNNNTLLGAKAVGLIPTPEELTTLESLTERYKRAKACFDEGKYLACLEIAAEPA